MKIAVDAQTLATPEGGIRHYLESTLQSMHSLLPEAEFHLWFYGAIPESARILPSRVHYRSLGLPSWFRFRGVLAPLLLSYASWRADVYWGPCCVLPWFCAAPLRFVTFYDASVWNSKRWWSWTNLVLPMHTRRSAAQATAIWIISSLL